MCGYTFPRVAGDDIWYICQSQAVKLEQNWTTFIGIAISLVKTYQCIVRFRHI